MPSLYNSETNYLTDQTYEYMHIHASGDFNGDGSIDFFGAFNDFGTDNAFPIVIYSLDQTTSTIRDVTSEWIVGGIPNSVHGRTVEVADFNGDGVDDIFMGDTGRDTPPDFPGNTNMLLLSQAGQLVNASNTLPQAPDFTHGSASGDIDGDGDIDILVGNFTTAPAAYNSPYFLINNGSGGFSQQGTFVPASLLDDQDAIIGSAELADFNGDGKTDLIIGSHSLDPNRIYFGDGTGNFGNTSYTELPVQSLGGQPGNAVNIHSFDLENDGDLDLAISYYGAPDNFLDASSYRNRAIQVLENDGSGTFTDVTSRFPSAVLDNGHGPAQYFIEVESRDLNKDGIQDLYVSNLNTAGQSAFGDTPVAWVSNQSGGYTVLDEEFFGNELGNNGYPAPLEFVGLGNDLFTIGYRAEFLRNITPFEQAVLPREGGGQNSSQYELYRFYNTDTGAHFFTTSVDERNSVILNMPNFSYEGNAFDSTATDSNGGVAVHRFYNSQNGIHFYTASEEERKSILNTLPHFGYEGVGYYAYADDTSGGTALFRFLNTSNGSHFYTTSETERDNIINTLGHYNYEGVAYYVEIA